MIGDTHAYIYPLEYEKWMDILKQYFYNVYIPMLKERAKPGDICVHTGDLFHNRTYVPLDVMVGMYMIMEDIAKILPVHIITGNHDLFTKESTKYSYLYFFKDAKNINVYHEPCEIEFNNNKILLMPWIEQTKKQIDTLNKYKHCDYVFCHSDLKGAKLHSLSVSNNIKDDHKVGIEEFRHFKHVYSGHIHIVQQNNNFTFIGSTYHMDRSDRGNKKGIFILDTDTGEHEFIPNNTSPEFKKIVIKTDGDLSLLAHYDTSNSFTDLEVNNDLFIGNRKNKKLLMEITQNKSFKEVKYINNNKNDDIIVKETDVIANDTPMDISLGQKDVINRIIEYGDRIQYPSDEVREGVVGLLKEITGLYNTEKGDLTI